MSENTNNTTPGAPVAPVVPVVESYTATVTILTPTTRTVTIPKAEFFKGYGPSAKAGVAGRVDSLLTGYVLKHQAELLPDLPADAQVVRVDVQP